MGDFWDILHPIDLCRAKVRYLGSIVEILGSKCLILGSETAILGSFRSHLLPYVYRVFYGIFGVFGAGNMGFWGFSPPHRFV